MLESLQRQWRTHRRFCQVVLAVAVGCYIVDRIIRKDGKLQEGPSLPGEQLLEITQEIVAAQFPYATDLAQMITPSNRRQLVASVRQRGTDMEVEILRGRGLELSPEEFFNMCRKSESQDLQLLLEEFRVMFEDAMKAQLPLMPGMSTDLSDALVDRVFEVFSFSNRHIRAATIDAVKVYIVKQGGPAASGCFDWLPSGPAASHQGVSFPSDLAADLKEWLRETQATALNECNMTLCEYLHSLALIVRDPAHNTKMQSMTRLHKEALLLLLTDLRDQILNPLKSSEMVSGEDANYGEAERRPSGEAVNDLMTGVAPLRGIDTAFDFLVTKEWKERRLNAACDRNVREINRRSTELREQSQAGCETNCCVIGTVEDDTRDRPERPSSDPAPDGVDCMISSNPIANEPVINAVIEIGQEDHTSAPSEHAGQSSGLSNDGGFESSSEAVSSKSPSEFETPVATSESFEETNEEQGKEQSEGPGEKQPEPQRDEQLSQQCEQDEEQVQKQDEEEVEELASEKAQEQVEEPVEEPVEEQASEDVNVTEEVDEQVPDQTELLTSAKEETTVASYTEIQVTQSGQESTPEDVMVEYPSLPPCVMRAIDSSYQGKDCPGNSC